MSRINAVSHTHKFILMSLYQNLNLFIMMEMHLLINLIRNI